MFKPTFSNTVLFLFIKYVLFYALLMVKNNDYTLLEAENLIGGHTLTYFFLVMLPYPLINMLLFSFPIYYSFKVKKAIYFVLLLAFFLFAEYLVYLLYTSSGEYLNLVGFYNAIISLLLFILFFFKSINYMLEK
jgi:hypothetical protein